MKEPKVRFKGFSGEWEKHSLAEKDFSIIAGGDIDRTIFQKSGKYPVIANAITSDGILGYYEKSYRVKGPAVTVTGRGDVGIAFARHYSFTPVVRLLAIKSTHNVDFLANAINLCKVPIESTGVPQLTTYKLQEYNLFMPHTIYEEDKLAAFITTLDSLIQSTTKKIESVKHVKAASLQSMFPQEGETTPRVRFKGFEGEWSCIEFGSIITECLDKTTTEDEDVLLSSAIDGVYLNSELFGHFRGKSNIGYRKLKKNMLILSAQNLHLGNANVNLRFEHGIVSPAYKIYYIHDCNSELLSHWIKREETKKFFLDATTAGASTCRKNIVWEDLYNQTLYLPKDELEQQKLASYFTSLDSQITLQTQRLEKLKQIKSACLDNMFV